PPFAHMPHGLRTGQQAAPPLQRTCEDFGSFLSPCLSFLRETRVEPTAHSLSSCAGCRRSQRYHVSSENVIPSAAGPALFAARAARLRCEAAGYLSSQTSSIRNPL